MVLEGSCYTPLLLNKFEIMPKKSNENASFLSKNTVPNKDLCMVLEMLTHLLSRDCL